MRCKSKIQHELANQLKTNHTYLFTGYFEVGSKAKFGALQLKAHSIESVGASFVTMQQEAVTKEIIEGQLLNKYKDDFSGLLGRAYCKVGLVTSPFSKAVGDVKAVLKRRSGIEIELFEVKLNNVGSIVNGIHQACESVCDVILIIRGGGKETDFRVFNDIEVIQAMNVSDIPIITGLGHTVNFTLADQVADRSENTPTKAAQFLVDKLGKVRDHEYDISIDKEMTGSFQNVLKESNAEYQHVAYNSTDPGRRKVKKPNLIIIITIVVVLLYLYYLITK